MLQRLLDYYKNNPKGYWFKRKIWGWGWVPVTWQGWAVVGLWLAAIALCTFTLDEGASPQDVMFTFVLPIFILTSLLIAICYKTGEPPRWQWGLRDSDKDA